MTPTGVVWQFAAEDHLGAKERVTQRPQDMALNCPRCHGSIVRVRRHLIDRLISLVLRRHRYRCLSMGCGWEGSLRRRAGVD
jgi:hypothetical protein